VSSYTPASSSVAVEKGPRIRIGTHVRQVGDCSYYSIAPYRCMILDLEYVNILRPSKHY
jgi:hypothetical protein